MTAEESRSAARRYFEEFHNGRRDDLLSELVVPDLVAPTRQATDALRTAFPDYRITIEVHADGWRRGYEACLRDARWAENSQAQADS